MTSTPLFHETARQLWVNGLLSRQAVNRLYSAAQPDTCGCRSCRTRRAMADATMSDAFHRTNMALDAAHAGLNARLDRLG